MERPAWGAEPPAGPHGGESSGETSWRWMAWGMFFKGGLHQTCWRGRILLEGTLVGERWESPR